MFWTYLMLFLEALINYVLSLLGLNILL